ncbi:hypothetical protein EVG20_g5304 [Dentipellis fragilis]|uniref:Methyltransferase domain-containing protein n=1 Tax=Dentipellis fragilis TaxID=205917 RepID=A0A4Y9YUC6_9AGAM|nr:hypothetical protein EVG20_g5304 [Dentipellis fragilis]
MPDSSTYVLAGVDAGKEWERLDTMHNAVDNYLGHKLTPAPSLGHPRKILELGAGSGAWAIQAAKQFPDAEVIAVDISPLPPRPTPVNMKSLQADVAQALPFEPESFDIVHIRYALIHLPHGTAHIPKLGQLVAPGGLLLIDDISLPIITGDAPAVRESFETLAVYMRSKHQDPRIADTLEAKLRESGLFSDVDAFKVSLPLNTPIADPAAQRLSRAFKDSITNVFVGELPAEVRATGFTEELQKAYRDEVDVKEWDGIVEAMWTWSRKL